ncbi:MAG TPA: ABC transporter permease subunit [Terriglobia bacterium]|nr:ABC transporter permease subunit [Terriglobia bacterium]
MNWSVVRLLYIHELTMLLRARRTVIMAVLLPAVMMPLMLYAQKYSRDRRERALRGATYAYTIAGPLADRIRKAIDDVTRSLAISNDEDLQDLRQLHLQEFKNNANPRRSLDNNEIQFYIETFTGDEADKLAAKAKTPPRNGQTPPAERRLQGVPIVNVVYREDRDTSNSAHNEVMAVLRLARRRDADLVLMQHGFPADPDKLFTVADASVATNHQVTGSVVGRFITLFLVMMMFTGGAVAAMDIIAGEKERGTLETLLTTAAGRADIAAAKQLAITTVALVITLIQGLNFILYIRLKLIPLPKDFDLQLPTGMAVTLLVLFIPLAATIASILLMISAYAKTYKESQMYFFPVYIIGLIPSLAAVMPGISLRSAIAFVPVANVSVAAREILMGRPDPAMIAVTFGVMVFAAAYLVRSAARLLSREDIILPAHTAPAEFLGGPALFQRRVLRWFALMWVVTFVVATNVPALSSFRRQLLFNELVVMIGACLLMMRTYSLDPREVLSLKSVKPAVWPAILFAIPAGYITALGIFRVVNFFIPAPQQLLERFSEDVIPKGMPTWEVILYVAILPAICEELAFRGILLSGLRRKLRPIPLVIGVGVIFGLFHVTLYRIAPTAALGMILTAIALMTGSVFPGMLLHAGNNAIGVIGGDWFSIEALHWRHYAAAAAIFALSLWIIYRNRAAGVTSNPLSKPSFFFSRK